LKNLYALELLEKLLSSKELNILEIVWQDDDVDKQVKTLMEPKKDV